MARQWAMRATGEKPRWPVTTIAREGVGLGLLISFLTGAAAGTMILPVFYTVAGAVVGLVAGVVPTLLGTAGVVVIARRHRPLRSPNALLTELTALFTTMRRLLALTGIVILGVWMYVIATEDSGEPLGGLLLVLLWVGFGPYIAACLVLKPLLRRAALRLTATFARHSGWEVIDARCALAQGSPWPGDSQVGGSFGRVIPEGAP
jgi:hypothetical protein